MHEGVFLSSMMDTVNPMNRKGSTTRVRANGHHAAEPPPVPGDVVRELTQVFRLLGDEARLRILIHLAQAGELHVTALCARLGQGQPAVSHHLALLRVAGLIEARREGKHNYYRLSREACNDALARLLSAVGPIPRRIALRDFALTHATRRPS
jgi:ArsR family transcriptional regulator